MLLQIAVLSLVCMCSDGFLFAPSASLTTHAPAGEIIGSVSTVDIQGRRHKVRQFLGIPYAEAPIGDRRFRKPVPKATFTSPYNATKAKPACFQIQNTNATDVSEDCLTLNIYIPEEDSLGQPLSDLPVMVYIYGGGFVYGDSNLYIPQTLSAFGDVVVVTINYRVAAMGFLSTGDSNSPGNYGLWDQHLAIQWVHDNIQAFGGNRSSVTIFGESAGSSSVIYQALYPGNRGLIHRAIAESGSITSFWGFMKDYKSPLMAFAGAAGCTGNTNSEIMVCLRSKTSDELYNVSTDVKDSSVSYPWKPVVDGEFVVEDPRKILSGGSLSSPFRAALQDVDLMLGVNNIDGAILLPDWSSRFNQTVNAFLPTEQQYSEILTDSLKSTIKAEIPDVVKTAATFEYTNWTHCDGFTRLTNLVSLVTDHSLNVPAIQTLAVHYGHKRSYLYQFATKPSFGHLIPIPKWMDGPTVANHADDLVFVFGFEPRMLQGANSSATDLEVSFAVMAMLTNFAKTGDPNSPRDVQPFLHTTWPQYDPKGQKYLEITPNMGPGSVKEKLAPRAVEFWSDLVPALIAAATSAGSQTNSSSSIFPFNPVDIIG